MWHEGRLVIFFVLTWVQAIVLAQGSSSLFTSYVPLAVRSPYLSAWLNTTNIPFNTTNPFDPNIERAPSRWPLFYGNANQILGWAGLIRVDNVTFKFLGNPGAPGNLNRSILTDLKLTPTRTILNATAGPVDLQITWLSPIEPSDLVAQSLPFSYMSVQVKSNDGQSHSVQVYSDISAEWSSGDRKQAVNWDVITTDQVVFHEQMLQVPQALSETASQALDATTYWGMQQGTGVTYMADTDSNCRNLFANQGSLANTVSSGPLPINNPFTVYAISKSLGSVGSDLTAPVIWGVGMLRDPAVAYLTPGGTVENRDPYWKTAHSTLHDAVTSALLDTSNAFDRSSRLDASILQNAAKVSSNYADLVSVAARQAMAGIETTVSPSNASDIMMFMKDIGASSSNVRVSPVEVLYSSFPSFLFVNASYGGYLLKPLLELSNSSHWTFDYAPQDLGTYPNATGNLEAHNEEVEQTGNMLIMTLAHARASGDGSLISEYYNLLKGWGDYLVANSFPVPSNQLNADQQSKANSTNLAIKGMIGIQALSQISQILNNQADFEHYSTIATTYVNMWRSLALSTDTSTPQHVLSNYGASSSSWVLPYNLFADKWLQTNLIPDTVYSNEEAFLKTLTSSNIDGLSIVNDPTSPSRPGNTAWTLFTAATVNDTSVRDSLILPIWNHVSQNNSGTIFPTNFDLNNQGSANGNNASPGVGGIFAPLALTIPKANIIVPATSGKSASSPSEKKTNVGAIVGGVIAGIVGLGILIFLVIFFWRRSREEQGDTIEKAIIQPGDTVPEVFPYNSVTPHEQLPQASQPTFSTQSPADSNELGSTPVGMFPSSKARSRALPPTPRSTPPMSSSAYSTSDQTASSREPPSRATSSRSRAPTSPISSHEVQGLRVEVENLRRVMQSFQNDRFDPPPEYGHE
ncbi:hypothetical protein BDY19DRAFT_1057674 [Irpex rosettiformis]|uniref:Uncharacterized protein n=1 Tax=Irpex rosettiformis TaxID=378272 RepID=A0ACB8U172_9APHY|nr:hypothetical protein BDY19DRAFT_1057674 [Irpex rosettiformis]